MNKPPTKEFFTIYCMLWNRKNNVLSKIGYLPIYLAMNYIRMNFTEKDILRCYVQRGARNRKMAHSDENITIDCNAITGIKITYTYPIDYIGVINGILCKNCLQLQ